MSLLFNSWYIVYFSFFFGNILENMSPYCQLLYIKWFLRIIQCEERFRYLHTVHIVSPVFGLYNHAI